MNKLFRNFFGALPLAAKAIVLIYLAAFPLGYLGNVTHTFDLYGWLGLCPALVWKGQIWRMLTYGFLPANPVDWLLGSFWLATLVSILGRVWSCAGFWGYCLLGSFGGAVPIVLFRPGAEGTVAGAFAMVFALLAAWDWFYRNERLLLLGVGEVSARQAALLVALINSVVIFFSCAGWFMMLAMWCGGVAGWLWLFLSQKFLHNKPPQQLRSERVARLEL